MPNRHQRARAAVRRDVKLAKHITSLYRAQFRVEFDEVEKITLQGGNPANAVDEQAWANVVGDAFVYVGRAVFDQHYITLTGELPPELPKVAPKQEIVALVQQIIGGGRPATRVTTMIEEHAAGISVRSRRHIETLLRDANLTQLRDVVAGLRRLYLTDFVKTRAYREALNTALRASIVFEDQAARRAQERLRGKYRYVKIWTTVGDYVVREWHAEADGQARELDDPFDVWGEMLQYPRDPAGSPGNTFNCRCWVEHERINADAPAV